MIFQFQKDLYSQTAMLKAAYHFTDDYYVHLAVNAEFYTVTLTPKKEGNSSLQQEQFQNEILAQTIKEIVSADTKNLRTILMARAMSSSMIGDVLPNTESNETAEKADTILKDWFSQNE